MSGEGASVRDPPSVLGGAAPCRCPKPRKLQRASRCAGTIFRLNLSDLEMPIEVIIIARGCGEQMLGALWPGQFHLRTRDGQSLSLLR